MSRKSNPANTVAPLIEPIFLRWSPRAFSDRPVSARDLQTILSAGQWAASSFNEQPWRYIVVRKEDAARFQVAVACLTPRNQSWAKAAPVLMFAVGKPHFSHNEKPNRVWMYDVGAASCQMALQSTAMGLCMHQMGGVDLDAVRRAFDIPAEFEPVAALALGYAAEPGTLAEEFVKSETSPRKRLALEEIAYGGRWGQPLG
ncbi:MAG: hypothetical protein BIFFINMI_01965 [Phycisphaerae bacterium]|nr:hypothetical protein [Phycisphaerae bacterium]